MIAGDPTFPKKLILVHLSDIHFHFKKGEVGGDAVLDEDIRRELHRDVVSVVSELGRAHGILVTGDVAFAARPEEYEAADKWLGELCTGTKCDAENIWVVCGNHDVQRDIIKNSKLMRAFQAELRDCEASQVDNTLSEYVSDPEGRKLAFSALQNYNEFACKYNGYFSGEQPFWEEDLLLNDGSKLRIRGVNSALSSNSQDDAEAGRKLSLGASNCAVQPADGVEHMLLCHHPLDWLRDAEQVEPYLDSRVRLQLFGHKHKKRIQESKVREFSCLKLHAGAVNPERDGIRVPRYNCLAIYVETESAKKLRTLCVDLHPRVWDPDNPKFIPDSPECESGRTFRTIRLPLKWINLSPATMTAAANTTTEFIDRPHVANPLAVAVTPEQAASKMWGSRRLVHRFLSLTFPQRMAVANQLKLLEPADSHADDTELFKRLLRRASERSQLRAFFEAVEIMHTGKPPAENPFP